ncbi:YibE/F family protein [Actinomadura sp. ATCC 31491]|uniref:YibE/F family protein n=1 Tax=Actinomadura luzonensis TaxID=2805427 RepID=A0ABT0G2L1_9ACTN|nr:YibE/F family protein [Actinomadura luzonensis]MCK2218846.1 YibE/F family protein [Actinomadura luzonensis]
MGADHAHGPAAPLSRRTLMAGLAVLVPLAIVTLAALIWLWPDGGQAAPTPEGGSSRVTGTVTSVTLTPCAKASEGAPQPDPATCGEATVRIGEGADAGRQAELRLPSGPGAQRFAAGDEVILLRGADGAYQLSDHDRGTPLLLFGLAFALAVIAFGRWRGLTALAGLAVTFVLLLTFVIPGIVEGRPPILVAVVGSAAIMLAVLYLTHGFSPATSMAVLGTLAALALTAGLSYAALGFTELNGVTDDVAVTVGMSLPIDTRGLLLAGIIIGALGVLDDVTVTQAVTVGELARADPAAGFTRLYRSAMRVGRAHIASVINTIILAYAGASLPLLLLFSLGSQPLGEVLTTPVVAQEIVRSIAGTLGLISAVPVTTALAALTASRQARRAPERAADEPGDEGFFGRTDEHDHDDDFFARLDAPPARPAARPDARPDPRPAARPDVRTEAHVDVPPVRPVGPRDLPPVRPAAHADVPAGRPGGGAAERRDSPVPEGGFFTPATQRPADGQPNHGQPLDGRRASRHRRRT